MIGMMVSKKEMFDRMTVGLSAKQVHQRARPKIQEKGVIGFNQIPSRSTCGVQIGSGTENSQSHRLHHHQNMSYGDGVEVSSV